MSADAVHGPGRLFVVSTPIGNLEDITLRALRVLREVHLIAAEDTRHTRKLLAHFDIHTPLSSFYQHRQFSQAPALVRRLLGGASLALVTDAGTPGISDPGAVLVRLAIEAGIEVTPVPGPAAATTLLSVSGLDTHAFVFEGFLPIKPGRKRRVLEGLARERRTLVFYESPHRLAKTLALMLEVLGDRPAAVGRELTKVFEEITRGRLSAALERYREKTVKGELTIAVAGSAEAPRTEMADEDSRYDGDPHNDAGEPEPQVDDEDSVTG
jgi:16S rRNA (cytidine1402-2'-O)-methyltransferase